MAMHNVEGGSARSTDIIELLERAHRVGSSGSGREDQLRPFLLMVTERLEHFAGEITELRREVTRQKESVPELMSVRQVAERLGCSPDTVRKRLIDKGILPAFRLPSIGGEVSGQSDIRVRRRDLEALLENLQPVYELASVGKGGSGGRRG